MCVPSWSPGEVIGAITSKVVKSGNVLQRFVQALRMPIQHVRLLDDSRVHLHVQSFEARDDVNS